MKTVCALFWSFFLIDRWGRRPLLILGSLGGSLSMAYLAAYIAIGKPQERPVGSPVRPFLCSPCCLVLTLSLLLSPQSDAGGRAALG
jgi:hypothetical protein